MKKTLYLTRGCTKSDHLRKIWMTMKLSVFLLFVTLTQMMATEAYAQFTKLTLQIKDATVKEVLNQIEDNSEFFFLYNSKLVDVDRRLSIEAKDEKIDEILKNIFQKTNVVFTVIDKQIVLTSKADQDSFILIGDQQSTKTITGQVSDEKGTPMPGVNIQIEGTTNGTLTDFDGKFSIKIPNENSILNFSFIGYDLQKINVDGKSAINVSLVPSLESLDEVVVIGYGTARRSDLVGATSSISTKDVINQPAARVDQVLQGRSAGIAIQNTSASPNARFSIRIRGSNSLTGSNDPLVVVDGFIGGDLSTINPNDIDGIEILKDASSTAIYGSRGANGVILVTTKKGKTKTAVEFNSYMNFSQLSNKIHQMNASQYAETVNANRIEVGRPAIFTAQEIADFAANGGTDWQDQVFHNAIQQGHQISLSGAGPSSNYYLSGNFTQNNGIIIGSSYNQYSLRSNIESDISKIFKAGVNIFLASSADHPSQTGGNQDNSPTQGALLWAPVLPVYNPDGSYTLSSSKYGPPSVKNPVGMAVEPIRDNLSLRDEISSYLNVNIIKGLSARVFGGVVLVDRENSSYSNTKAAGGVGEASASITTSRSLVFQNTNQFTYAFKVANIHDFNIMAAFEQQRELYNSASTSSSSYSSDVVTYNNLSLGAKVGIPSSTATQKDILSYLGRINYAYKDKYLLSLNSRYDGASVFGTQKWGFFPSAALAWRVTSEDFMKNINIISNLKLRTSYGLTGNQGIAPYSSISKLSTSKPYDINGSTVSVGVGLNTLGNPDLKWEKTAQLNLGVDVGLFEGRVTFSADYYDKQTNDLLMNVPLPTISGYASLLKNIGKVQNRGFEFNLGGDPFSGEFKWNTNFNFALNRNKVVALSGTSEVPMGTTTFPNFGNTIFLIVGQPMGILKGYIQNGCWSVAEATEAAKYGALPGYPKYVDQNGDFKINAADIAIMGSTMPKFTFGWSNNFTFKNFDLNILLQGSQGGKVYNTTRIRSERTSSDADAVDIRILNRWTIDNQNTSVPTFTGSNGYEQLQSNRWLEDGSYLRFKIITLGYSIPTSVLKKAKLSNTRIFVSAVNWFTITKYTGYDPEASTGVDVMGGIDLAPYPSQKTISVGINLKF